MPEPYGTLSSPNVGGGSASQIDNNATADEQAGLLGGNKPSSITSSHHHRRGRHSLLPRVTQHFRTNVSKSWSDLILLGGYLITGLLDSSSVLIWGSFVSMQTGNTVYLGTGLISPSDPTSPKSDRWIRAAISIASFVVGSFFFSRFHASLSSRKRWVMVSAAGLQLSLVLAAALLVTLEPESRNHRQKLVPTSEVAVPIALVAFQSAGQAVVSRVVGFKAYTGVVLTSIYCDLGADRGLFEWRNAERNRRLAAPVLLLVGAMLGGLWARSDTGMLGALWTAVGLKVGIILAWVFWAEEKGEDEDD